MVWAARFELQVAAEVGYAVLEAAVSWAPGTQIRVGLRCRYCEKFSDYPPEKRKDNTANSCEAEMLARRLPVFQGLKNDEFRPLWNFVINGDAMSGGERYTSGERERAVRQLHQIVKTAARLREAYAAYQLRTSNIPVTVPFSLRESVDAATSMHLPKFAGVKDAIVSVIVPKGADRHEKD